jgi:hypothetical protein
MKIRNAILIAGRKGMMAPGVLPFFLVIVLVRVCIPYKIIPNMQLVITYIEMKYIHSIVPVIWTKTGNVLPKIPAIITSPNPNPSAFFLYFHRTYHFAKKYISKKTQKNISIPCTVSQRLYPPRHCPRIESRNRDILAVI